MPRLSIRTKKDRQKQAEVKQEKPPKPQKVEKEKVPLSGEELVIGCLLDPHAAKSRNKVCSVSEEEFGLGSPQLGKCRTLVVKSAIRTVLIQLVEHIRPSTLMLSCSENLLRIRIFVKKIYDVTPNIRLRSRGGMSVM